MTHWRTDGRAPERRPLEGETVRVVPVEPARHGADLYAAIRDAEPGMWEYMGYGPFPDRSAFLAWLTECSASEDPLFFAIVPRADGRAAGMASFLRMAPQHGVVEIGHIWFAPVLRRTRAATEAIYLMMRHALDDLGYRRLEWKCDARNQRSRRAAERFGFTFEGVFRQHMIVKGRNRDTAWYALIDRDWPEVKTRFEAWLAPENFDDAGRQKTVLRALGDLPGGDS